MSRNELKKIIYKFNSVSNRLLQSGYAEYKNDLRKFIEYIDSTEIIKEFVNSCGECEQDMSKEFDEIANPYHDYIFSIGDTDSEEVSDVYGILRYMCMEYKGHIVDVISGYSHSTKYNDMIKGFNHKVVMLLIRHIEVYLTEVGINMGLDENVTYNINGTQVNIANDNATINATQVNNSFNVDEFKKLISVMRDSLSCDLSDEDKADANESIDIIESELLSGNPNEENVKSNFKLLKRIDAGLKFTSACCSVLTFADKMFPFLESVKNWFQSII